MLRTFIGTTEMGDRSMGATTGECGLARHLSGPWPRCRGIRMGSHVLQLQGSCTQQSIVRHLEKNKKARARWSFERGTRQRNRCLRSGLCARSVRACVLVPCVRVCALLSARLVILSALLFLTFFFPTHPARLHAPGLVGEGQGRGISHIYIYIYNRDFTFDI